MSPENLFIAGNISETRGDGCVPIESWREYSSKWLGPIRLYDTYMYLPLHKEEVINSVRFAKENVPNNPGRILVLGSGQNSLEISTLHKTFNEPEIIATDIQPRFLETLMNRLRKHDRKAFDQTYPVQMDIGSPWPMTVTDGEKSIKLDSVPFVFCNIVFNWLTEQEQEGVFKNVSERLSPDGDFILATLTDHWDSKEVKKHIPEQLVKNPFWTILGAVGARRWADQTALQFGIHRPSVKDIHKLANNYGLEVKSVDEDRIFWKTKDGAPTAIVCHLKKK